LCVKSIDLYEIKVITYIGKYFVENYACISSPLSMGQISDWMLHISFHEIKVITCIGKYFVENYACVSSPLSIGQISDWMMHIKFLPPPPICILSILLNVSCCHRMVSYSHWWLISQPNFWLLYQNNHNTCIDLISFSATITESLTWIILPDPAINMVTFVRKAIQ
jgi:hypothetical protein